MLDLAVFFSFFDSFETNFTLVFTQVIERLFPLLLLCFYSRNLKKISIISEFCFLRKIGDEKFFELSAIFFPLAGDTLFYISD